MGSDERHPCQRLSYCITPVLFTLINLSFHSILPSSTVSFSLYSHLFSSNPIKPSIRSTAASVFPPRDCNNQFPLSSSPNRGTTFFPSSSRHFPCNPMVCYTPHPSFCPMSPFSSILTNVFLSKPEPTSKQNVYFSRYTSHPSYMSTKNFILHFINLLFPLS